MSEHTMAASVAKPAPAATEPKPAGSKPLRDPAPYVVTDVRQELVWMSDDAQLAAWTKGERLPLSSRRMARALPGETVKGLPAVSVPGLLASRWIVKPGSEWRIKNPPAPSVEATTEEAS